MADTPDSQNQLIDAAWQQIERVDSTIDGGRGTYATQALQTAFGAMAAPNIGELPGYDIQFEIHRGGQGVVYRAIQQSTGRTVAIKVMLGGQFAGQRQLARFEREVRILAQIQHPNIVTIYDSGVEDGVAYFVMDCIEGRTFGDYLRDPSIDIKDKLRTFADICDAVNAAHLHGVIHRDLKPSNILIDERGDPKILDFGLAKPIGDTRAADGEVTMTETGQFVGSLPWASPEQVQGESAHVDLRTDVYSLGVMLYQMMTGEFPYPVRGELSEVITAIKTQEPRVPTRTIDSDLATVALTALQKEPQRRYQSAGALKLDIQRYLAGEPIEARRASLLYLLRRRISRHKWIAVLLATLAASLIVGTIVATSLWRVAVRRAEEAATEAARAEAVTEFLSRMMLTANPSSGGESSMTVKQAVDQALVRLDGGELKEQPMTEAALRLIIGNTYSSLGRYAAGREQLERARDTILSETGIESRETIEALIGIGSSLRQEGRFDEAEVKLFHAMTLAREQFGRLDTLVASVLATEAAVLRNRQQLDASEERLRKALAIVRDPALKDDPEARRMEPSLLNDLSLTLAELKRYEQAVEIQQEAVALFRDVMGERSFGTALGISNLASRYTRLGDFESAAAQFETALEIAVQTGGEAHPEVARVLDAMADLRRLQGDLSQALELLQRSLALRQQTLPKGDMAIAHSLNDLAVICYEQGQFEQALEHMYSAIEIMRAGLEPHHPKIATMLSNIAGMELARGNRDDAILLLRQAMESQEAHWGAGHINTAAAVHNLGQALSENEAYDEAEALLREALQLRTRDLKDSDPAVSSSLDSLAGVLQRKGDLDEAEKYCRQALALREQYSRDSQTLAFNYNNLALIHSDRKQYEKAAELIEKAISLAMESLPADHWRVAQLKANLASTRYHLGERAAAEAEMTAAYEVLKAKLGNEHPLSKKFAARLSNLFGADHDGEAANEAPEGKADEDAED